MAHRLSPQEGPGQNEQASADRGRREAASCGVRHAQAPGTLQPLTTPRCAGDDWVLTSHGMSRLGWVGGESSRLGLARTLDDFILDHSTITLSSFMTAPTGGDYCPRTTEVSSGRRMAARSAALDPTRCAAPQRSRHHRRESLRLTARSDL